MTPSRECCILRRINNSLQNIHSLGQRYAHVNQICKGVRSKNVKVEAPIVRGILSFTPLAILAIAVVGILPMGCNCFNSNITYEYVGDPGKSNQISRQ